MVKKLLLVIWIKCEANVNDANVFRLMDGSIIQCSHPWSYIRKNLCMSFAEARL